MYLLITKKKTGFIFILRLLYGFETRFANGLDVVFREIKEGENILNLND
jgi:hypothetical protein